MLLLAFKGTANDMIYDRMDVHNDLFTQFNSAIEFIKKHINLRSIIEGTYRRDVYEVPEPVIREAVANAIVHRDYSMEGTDITVSVFDDRLEIKNPGGLMPGVTEKNIGAMSIRRNPLLSGMFNRVDIIEKAGTGFTRMRHALKQEGFPEPEITDDSFFFITFKRVYNLELLSQKLNTDTSEATQKTILKTSLKTSLKIYELLKNNPKLSFSELSDSLGMSINGIKWNIEKLRTQGRLRRIGPDKGGHWEVLE
jgi:ATP-dependent DNA helicase RecG